MSNPFYRLLVNNQLGNTPEIKVFWANVATENSKMFLTTQGGNFRITNFSSLCSLSIGDRVFVMQNKSDFTVLGKVV